MKDVFTDDTKDGAYNWNLPGRTNADGDLSLAFNARLPRVEFSDVRDIE